MREKVYQYLIELTNGKYSSSVLKRVVSSTFSKKFIRDYTKVYGIDMSEVSRDIQSFSSLQEFFTRQLKEEARPIDRKEDVFVSPVDAKIETFGKIKDREIFTVKNKPYSLTDLLGKNELAAKYNHGHYIVFYLSPANYHRIHSPYDGEVLRQYVLGSKSYPVNQAGLSYGKKPISHNYRMINELQFKDNRSFTLIKVGAMFVNSIHLTNTATSWKKGEEIGYFAFGSTVVLLFEEDSITFTENVKAGSEVKMGEPIAIMV